MTLFSGPRRPHASGLVLMLTAALVGSTFAALPAAQADPAGTGLVVSEVYGGGGNSGATYQNDFVEVHNPTSAPIGLGGLSVQYRSATGTADPSGVVPLTDVDLPGGASYLVQLAGGTNGVPLPVTADQSTGSVNLSGTTGTVMLVDGTTALDPGEGDVRNVSGVVDLVGFGTSNTYENAATPTLLQAPAPSNTSSITRAGGADADDNSADFTMLAGSDMTPTPCGDACDAPPPPAPVERTIAEIQGTGFSTPFPGGNVTTTGVVTAAYPTGGIDGFFVQTAGSGGDTDATPGASDGLFVAGPAALAAMQDANDPVQVGDNVEVTGIVTEEFGKTTVTPETDSVVTTAGTGSVTPVATTWPEDSAGREQLEGMLLAPQGDFTVSDNYSLNRFAEIGLAQGTEPLFQPTDVADFGSPEAAAVADHNAAARVTLDDGASIDFLGNVGEDIPLPWLTDDPTIRVGEPVTFTKPVVLDYSFSLWRFQPTEQLTAADVNGVEPAQFGDTRTTAPSPVGGDLQVASFNVLNYFTDLGVDEPGCGFYYDRTETDPVTANFCDVRGAAEQEDLERQQAKIVHAINALGAEVVSLEEIENSAKFGHDRDESLATLVTALNADVGSQVWDYVRTPSDAPDPAGEDFIRTAFIFKPAAVELVGESKIRPSSEEDVFSNARDPLAQVFQPVGTSESDRFMLVVNHLKSKGSAPSAPDPDADYGQGGFNQRRVDQATALATWVEQVSAEAGVEKVYLDGDFNSYTQEDPMQVLYGADYTNLATEFDAAPTYLFGGLVGSLDHALANDAALASTTGAAVWNINSVESVALEYSRHNYNATMFYDGTTPYRASDHDPIVFGIATTQAPTTSVTADVSPDRVQVNKTRARLTAEVTSSDGTVVDDGTVTVSEGGTVLGSAPVDDGSATIVLPKFRSAGAHELTVTYTGVAQEETSTTVTVRVVKQKPSMHVTARPGRVVAHRTRVKVNAVLEADEQAVTGQVRFLAQGRSWTVRITRGKADVTLPAFDSAGTKRVTVIYLSDARNAPVAKTVTITVRRR